MKKTMSKEDTLKMKWSKRENSFMIYFPKSCDGSFLYHAFSDRLIYSQEKATQGNRFPFDVENLIKELEKRGYDKTTLKFEIKLKIEP